jgi:hypothetical protein
VLDQAKLPVDKSLSSPVCRLLTPEIRKDMKLKGDKRKIDELHPCKDLLPFECVQTLLSHFEAGARPLFFGAEDDQDPEVLRTATDQVDTLIQDLMARIDANEDCRLLLAMGQSRCEIDGSLVFLKTVIHALQQLVPYLHVWLQLQSRMCYMQKREQDLKTAIEYAQANGFESDG